MRRLPEAWIAPPHLRQLRELGRYRAKLVALRSGNDPVALACKIEKAGPDPMRQVHRRAGGLQHVGRPVPRKASRCR